MTFEEDDNLLLKKGEFWLAKHHILLDGDDNQKLAEKISIIIFRSLQDYFADAIFLFNNERPHNQGVLCRCIYEAVLHLWFITSNNHHSHATEIFLEGIKGEKTNIEKLIKILKAYPGCRNFPELQGMTEQLSELINIFESSKAQYESDNNKKFKESTIGFKLRYLKENTDKISDDLIFDLTRLYQDTCGIIHGGLLPNLKKILGKKSILTPDKIYGLSKKLYKSALEIVHEFFPNKE